MAPPQILALRAGTAAALLSLPLWVPSLAPNEYDGGRSTDIAAIEARNTSAVARLLGEFRASMSDMMFIKTEKYLHGGISYAPHMDLDRTAQTGELAHKGGKPEDVHGPHEVGGASGMAALELEDEEEGEEEEHAGVETLIPTPDKDFRAFIGALHREVKPWRDPSLDHIHDSGTELLPWYRLMTLSNPHNVRGYMIGAWWLKGFGTDEQKAEAVKFLEEGLRNNPKAFQLWLMMGYLLRQDGQHAEAMEYFHKAAELAASTRPADGTATPGWTDYKEEDARAAMRLSVLSEREYGDPANAPQLAAKYLESLGEDGVLQRALTGEMPGGE
ncbi:MAG: hypothetical protein SF028_13675 [Candidatus Sumerlaeia bacterium]|nr:hypothetical protein [Candidatus Sumerlaeia bacterium]